MASSVPPLSLAHSASCADQTPADDEACRGGESAKPIADKSIFADMFSKPGFAGALSSAEPDVVWRGGSLPQVFMDLVLGAEAMGRVVIELWPHKTPKSAENFRCLCTGERGVSRHSRRRLCYKVGCASPPRISSMSHSHHACTLAARQCLHVWPDVEAR